MMPQKLKKFFQGHEYDDGSRGTLNLYLFCVLFFSQSYAVLYYYYGSKFMGLSLFAVPWIFSPIVYILNRKRFFTGAKFLLIFSSLFYMSFTRIGVKEDVVAETYCFPAIMMTLVFFDLRQRLEILYGLFVSITAWLYLRWGPTPNLSPEWYSDHFPTELFRTLAFIGSAGLTALFSVEFAVKVQRLKNSLHQELIKAQEVKKVLEDAQFMAKIGNWEMDLKTGAVSCSKEQLRLYEIDETLSKPLREQYMERLHPDHLDSERRLMEKILSTRSSYAHETKIILRSGEVRSFWSYAEPVFDKDGNLVRLKGMVQDITERKAQEMELLARQTKMAQSSKLASIGEMAAGIAHEINNPLMIIHGKVTQLINSVSTEKMDLEKFVRDLNKVLSTTDRIAKIVRGLRTLGRVTENDPMQKVSLKQILDETLDLGRERLKNSGIEVRVQCAEDFEVECREAEIGQVILNLVNNSFDAIQSLNEKWIEIKVRDQGERVEILVVDSGPGIRADLIEKLMNPFFTTKEVGKGTGLGLSISLGIMKNHNGDLHYQEENHHTGFLVSIPKKQPKNSNPGAVA